MHTAVCVSTFELRNDSPGSSSHAKEEEKGMITFILHWKEAYFFFECNHYNITLNAVYSVYIYLYLILFRCI
jgi:hypothetical protein